MGMDFWVLVWKWVWKITFFGLKSGQDLKKRAAHPHQEFSEVSPPGFEAALLKSELVGHADHLENEIGFF